MLVKKHGGNEAVQLLHGNIASFNLLPLRSAIRVAMDMMVRHILTKEIENKIEVRILRLWVHDYGIMVQESVRHPRQCHS